MSDSACCAICVAPSLNVGLRVVSEAAQERVVLEDKLRSGVHLQPGYPVVRVEQSFDGSLVQYLRDET